MCTVAAHVTPSINLEVVSRPLFSPARLGRPSRPRQFGWPHALTFWSIGVSVMAYLRWQLLVPGWGNYMLTSRGVTYECSHSPWIIISGWVSLVIGLMVSPYLPLRTTFCFFDIASIHQSDEDLKERGIYSIGGFLSVSNELRILWSRPYFSRLWCLHLGCGLVLHVQFSPVSIYIYIVFLHARTHTHSHYVYCILLHVLISLVVCFSSPNVSAASNQVKGGFSRNQWIRLDVFAARGLIIIYPFNHFAAKPALEV